MAANSRKSRTQTDLGLGWRHQQQRAILVRRLTDGSLCWWCGQPMHKDPDRNWDRRPLAADHSQARALGGTLADRLLHSTCNSARGDGSRDDARPVLTGKPVTAPKPIELAMDW